MPCSPASAPLALQLSDYFFSKPAAPAAGSADGGTKRGAGGAGGTPAAKRLRHQYVDANVEDEEEKAVKE